MEENKDQKTIEETKKNGIIVIGTTLVIGYILGRMSVNQSAVDCYRQGVSDTLNSIVFRH